MMFGLAARAYPVDIGMISNSSGAAVPTPKLPFRLPVDGYVLALLATVVVAAILPARGVGAEVMGYVTYLAVALLFFPLRRPAVAAGDPRRGDALAAAGASVPHHLPAVPDHWPGTGGDLPALARDTLSIGLLFVAVLPSTVQSSIAFTSIARGKRAGGTVQRLDLQSGGDRHHPGAGGAAC